jgi:hypothetical protein
VVGEWCVVETLDDESELESIIPDGAMGDDIYDKTFLSAVPCSLKDCLDLDLAGFLLYLVV